MAVSSIADLLLASPQTFTVIGLADGMVTLHDESDTAYVLPKKLAIGPIKIGDTVLVTIREQQAVERASQMVAKDVLQEMLGDDNE